MIVSAWFVLIAFILGLMIGLGAFVFFWFGVVAAGFHDGPKGFGAVRLPGTGRREVAPTEV